MSGVIGRLILIITVLLAGCDSRSHTAPVESKDSHDRQMPSVGSAEQAENVGTEIHIAPTGDCEMSTIALAFSAPDDDSGEVSYGSFVRALEERGVKVVLHTVDSVHTLVFVTLKVSDPSEVVRLANEPRFKDVVRILEEE